MWVLSTVCYNISSSPYDIVRHCLTLFIRLTFHFECDQVRLVILTLLTHHNSIGFWHWVTVWVTVYSLGPNLSDMDYSKVYESSSSDSEIFDDGDVFASPEYDDEENLLLCHCVPQQLPSQNVWMFDSFSVGSSDFFIRRVSLNNYTNQFRQWTQESKY